jgi:hypothetical protein
MLAQFSTQTKILLARHFSTRETTPLLFCFTLIFLLYLDVQTRQCRVSKDPHSRTSYRFTVRHLWKNLKGTVTNKFEDFPLRRP